MRIENNFYNIHICNYKYVTKSIRVEENLKLLNQLPFPQLQDFYQGETPLQVFYKPEKDSNIYIYIYISILQVNKNDGCVNVGEADRYYLQYKQVNVWTLLISKLI